MVWPNGFYGSDSVGLDYFLLAFFPDPRLIVQFRF